MYFLQISFSKSTCLINSLFYNISWCRHHPYQAIKDRINSCEEECEDTKERLEADIQGKRRQFELLNSKISSLTDPKGVESTIKKLDAEYKQLQARQQKEEKENMANIKAVTDKIEKKMKTYPTGLDDECDRMREEIVSLNNEVNW